MRNEENDGRERLKGKIEGKDGRNGWMMDGWMGGREEERKVMGEKEGEEGVDGKEGEMKTMMEGKDWRMEGKDGRKERIEGKVSDGRKRMGGGRREEGGKECEEEGKECEEGGGRTSLPDPEGSWSRLSRTIYNDVSRKYLLFFPRRKININFVIIYLGLRKFQARNSKY